MQTGDGEEACTIGDAHSPKEQAEERLPPVPMPQRVFGWRRSISVKQRIYNLIQEEELVSKQPNPGCRTCTNGKLCDPCRLEALKLARNQPKVWHDIIYKNENQTSAQRRRSNGLFWSRPAFAIRQSWRASLLKSFTLSDFEGSSARRKFFLGGTIGVGVLLNY